VFGKQEVRDVKRLAKPGLARELAAGLADDSAMKRLAFVHSVMDMGPYQVQCRGGQTASDPNSFRRSGFHLQSYGRRRILRPFAV